jgi:hypothetical protein
MESSVASPDLENQPQAGKRNFLEYDELSVLLQKSNHRINQNKIYLISRPKSLK